MASTRSVLKAGLAAACLILVEASVQIPIGKPSPGSIRFYQLPGLCGDGENAWYGLIEPAVLTDKDAFFVELMGGAVCFNKTSCNDTWLGAWFGITSYMKNTLKLNNQEIAMLKSGMDVPLAYLHPMGAGYLPFKSTHPFAGRRGIFFPTCTADVSMGRHNATYEDGFSAYHHGSINLQIVLNGVKAALPNITEFAIYGGSGGGVAASMWMQEVADMWPSANVTAFIDSGFHMMPGGSFFQFFWDNVAWSPGPGGNNPGKYTNVVLPKFDWRHKSAISAQLRAYKGRLRVIYAACSEDPVVFGDRMRMSKYSAFNGNSIQQLPEMWGFLTNLHKCAPAGSAFSYIAKCKKHHLSRTDWPQEANINGEITMQQFVENVLKGLPPDAAKPDRTNVWYVEQSLQNSGTTCVETNNIVNLGSRATASVALAVVIGSAAAIGVQG